MPGPFAKIIAPEWECDYDANDVELATVLFHAAHEDWLLHLARERGGELPSESPETRNGRSLSGEPEERPF